MVAALLFSQQPRKLWIRLWLCWVNRCNGAASRQGPRLAQMSACCGLWVLGAGGWGKIGGLQDLIVSGLEKA